VFGGSMGYGDGKVTGIGDMEILVLIRHIDLA
jgi:hypothetical protein